MTHPRPDYSGTPLHVYNRRVDKQTLFHTDTDYAEFQSLMERARKRVSLSIFEWCLMPNHWHIAVEPRGPRDLPKFMHWLCGTHAKLWRTRHTLLGEGPLYQRPYRAVPVQDGEHFDTLLAYIANNPVKAGLCETPALWRWSSAHRAINPDASHIPQLQSPNTLPPSAISDKQTTQIDNHLTALTPIGDIAWSQEAARRLGLPHARRQKGKPGNNHPI
jgi:putative transposase